MKLAREKLCGPAFFWQQQMLQSQQPNSEAHIRSLDAKLLARGLEQQLFHKPLLLLLVFCSGLVQMLHVMLHTQ